MLMATLDARVMLTQLMSAKLDRKFMLEAVSFRYRYIISYTGR